MNTDEFLVLSLGLALIVLAVHEFWAPQFGALFTPPSGPTPTPTPADGPVQGHLRALPPKPPEGTYGIH